MNNKIRVRRTMKCESCGTSDEVVSGCGAKEDQWLCINCECDLID